MKVEHFGGCEWEAIFKHKQQASAALDEADVEETVSVQGTLQLCMYRAWTVLRMAADSDRASAEAFNPVMAAPGLNINHRTLIQPIKVHKFSRFLHKAAFVQSLDHGNCSLESTEPLHVVNRAGGLSALGVWRVGAFAQPSGRLLNNSPVKSLRISRL
jgi:hypothetical protein